MKRLVFVLSLLTFLCGAGFANEPFSNYSGWRSLNDYGLWQTLYGDYKMNKTQPATEAKVSISLTEEDLDTAIEDTQESKQPAVKVVNAKNFAEQSESDKHRLYKILFSEPNEITDKTDLVQRIFIDPVSDALEKLDQIKSSGKISPAAEQQIHTVTADDSFNKVR